ncbi:DMT family transporter [Fictibacillus aquaticus]|uniref:EamA domain-containing protein n=1 Tax=Fictibacillus aquaticus TaxID=2021314 RepID=A0A235F4I6_9BACL|nr:EamA family transporter [Fictibacillus aquaticus]OYD56142.1 hypothetical protein CGZ90_19115 [Fictibacillus aquaticus]
MAIRHAYFSIIISAALWGTIGFYVNYLRDAGFTALQVVWLRAAAAVVFFFIYALFQKPSPLFVRLKDMKYFLGTGILSITLFNWCYFTAIQETSLSVAAVLLYTAPVFVIILSRFVFKSPLTARKLISLLLTAAGCLFVSGLLSDSSSSVTVFGIITGLGAGFGYALYSIFGKLAAAFYSSLTISFYTFLVTAAALLPFVQLKSALALLIHPETLLMAAGLGLFPTVIAYYLYTNGLKAADAGTASILSTVEPAVAALMGILFYEESLTFIQYAGIILIFSAVILLREKKTALSEISSTSGTHS